MTNKIEREELTILNKEVAGMVVKVEGLETTQHAVLQELKDIRKDISLAKAVVRGVKFTGTVLVLIAGFKFGDLWHMLRGL